MLQGWLDLIISEHSPAQYRCVISLHETQHHLPCVLTEDSAAQTPLDALGIKFGNKQPFPILKQMSGVLRPVRSLLYLSPLLKA